MSKKVLVSTLKVAAAESGFYFMSRVFQDEFLRYGGEVAPALRMDIKHIGGLGYKFLCFFWN